jgi:hypothetical protein
MNALRLLPSVVSGLAVSLVSISQAEGETRVFDPTIPSCTTTNCSSERISGTLGALGGGADGTPLSAVSWTLEIFAHRNHCLRSRSRPRMPTSRRCWWRPTGPYFAMMMEAPLAAAFAR